MFSLLKTDLGLLKMTTRKKKSQKQIWKCLEKVLGQKRKAFQTVQTAGSSRWRIFSRQWTF